MNRNSLLLPVVVLLGACAEPLPPERADYAGVWSDPVVYLAITRDGYLQYEKKEGNVTTNIDAPLREFQGDSFTVGVGWTWTTFEVSAAPHLDGDTWKMTVDGRELTRR